MDYIDKLAIEIKKLKLDVAVYYNNIIIQHPKPQKINDIVLSKEKDKNLIRFYNEELEKDKWNLRILFDKKNIYIDSFSSPNDEIGVMRTLNKIIEWKADRERDLQTLEAIKRYAEATLTFEHLFVGGES